MAGRKRQAETEQVPTRQSRMLPDAVVEPLQYQSPSTDKRNKNSNEREDRAKLMLHAAASQVSTDNP